MSFKNKPLLPAWNTFNLVVHSGTIADGAYIDGLVQERRNSSALAMELRLPCTNPSIYSW